MKRLFSVILLLSLVVIVPFSFTARAAPPDRGRGQEYPEIVGGREADPGAWPSMVSVGAANQSNGYSAHFCGGSLIHAKWVLTAAHCTEGEFAGSIKVIVGRHTLSSSEGERLAVSRIIVHPDYDPWTADNDIALLELAVPATAGTPVPNIRADQTPLAAPGIMSMVTGWGDLGNGQSPDALQEVDVPIVSNATCNTSYGGEITANMICAGYAQGGKDACYGDSGGPLFVPDETGTGWVQVGVVSWGEGCALPNYYGVYARVSRYQSWIESYVGTAPPPVDYDYATFLPVVHK